MTPKVKPGYGWKVTVKKVYPKAFCLTSHGVHAIAVDYGPIISGWHKAKPDAWKDAARRISGKRK
jgi:hypothetical protein